MSERLKPCPFCGGEASVVQYVGDLYAVVCNYCFVRTSKYSEKEKAVSAWNRRNGETDEET